MAANAGKGGPGELTLAAHADREIVMTRINWREVSKFLSGAAFSGSIANFYLFACKISLPFLGYTIPWQLAGVRSAVQFVVFVTCFYFGYLRRIPNPRPPTT